MGAKLTQYYDLVAAKGGLQAKMRLAMKTGISSTKAAEVPDTPDNLAKFYEVSKEILGADAPRL